MRSCRATRPGGSPCTKTAPRESLCTWPTAIAVHSMSRASSSANAAIATARGDVNAGTARRQNGIRIDSMQIWTRVSANSASNDERHDTRGGGAAAEVDAHLTLGFTERFWGSLDWARYNGGEATVNSVAGERLNNGGAGLLPG
jgi:hypothetical protein